MISRRVFLGTLAVGFLAAPLVAEAQQAGKVYRIGFLSARSRSDSLPLLEAFLQGLRELGWVEGKNIVIEYRWADGRSERLPDLAAELVRLKVDVIFAPNTSVAVAARNATSTIPIVSATMGDPVGLGLVASLARPGGNVTGLSYGVGLEIVGKQLELLKEAVPRVSRAAVLSNPANPSRDLNLREVEVAARALGVQLQRLEAQGPNDFDGAFAAMARERAGALCATAGIDPGRDRPCLRTGLMLPTIGQVARLSHAALIKPSKGTSSPSRPLTPGSRHQYFGEVPGVDDAVRWQNDVHVPTACLVPCQMSSP